MVTLILIAVFYASLGGMWLAGGQYRAWATAIFTVMVTIGMALVMCVIALLNMLGAARRL